MHPLPFDNLTNRNWSQDSDTLYVSVDAADLAAKKKNAKKLWVVVSSRSLLPGFWTDPVNGTPEFTQRCVVKKDYDFTWIEANEVPLASAGDSGFKVTNAKGAYYAFVLVQRADGELADVNVTKLGDETKNPPKGTPFTVKNAQTLNRTWDDDQRWACGQKGAKPPVKTVVAAEAPMVHPLPFDDAANRNWSYDAEVINMTIDKADLTVKLKDAKRVFVVLSARALLPEFWKDPLYGIPKFTHNCIVNKKYDFKWIEAFEVPIASLKGDQLKVTGAKGMYYAFLLIDKGDGRYADVKVTKLGDDTRNPPKADALTVKNPQTLTRVWDDDKKPMCK